MKDTFRFDKQTVTNYLIYDLNLIKKFKTSFKYLLTKLPIQKLIDLNEINWREGKNYKWCAIEDNGVILIIRNYRTHFTIFVQHTRVHLEYSKKEYGTFTYHSNTENLPDKENDELVCDNYKDLNVSLPQLFNLIRENRLHMLWNSYSLERPKHVEIKVIFDKETIDSIDTMIFACEELFQMHLELLAENEVLDKLKFFEVGEEFNTQYKVNYISTIVKDDYYHGVGLELIDKYGKTTFEDVYSLTRYFYNDIFNEGEEK